MATDNPFEASRDTPLSSGFEDEDLMLADRWTRLWARMVDGLLVIPAAIPGYVLMCLSGASSNEYGEPDEIGLLLNLAGLLLVLAGILGLQIYQWKLISATGQTLAKKWMNIRIVMVDGRPLGFMHGVVLREWILPLANVVVPFVSTIDALFIFQDSRQCLHDMIASTKVVSAYDFDDEVIY